MTTNRIKEIQELTAHPQSQSVQQALLKVWNECEQESNIKYKELLDSHNELLSICNRIGGLCSKEERELINKAKNIKQ